MPPAPPATPPWLAREVSADPDELLPELEVLNIIPPEMDPDPGSPQFLGFPASPSSLSDVPSWPSSPPPASPPSPGNISVASLDFPDSELSEAGSVHSFGSGWSARSVVHLDDVPDFAAPLPPNVHVPLVDEPVEDAQPIEQRIIVAPPIWWKYRDERERLALEARRRSDDELRPVPPEPVPAPAALEPADAAIDAPPVAADADAVQRANEAEDHFGPAADSAPPPQPALEPEEPEEAELPPSPPSSEASFDSDPDFSDFSDFDDFEPDAGSEVSPTNNVSNVYGPSDCDAAADFDFRTNPIKDGAWNHSSHVSKLLADGFAIQFNETMRGKAPRKFIPADEREMAYLKAMIRDGVIKPGEPVFSAPHYMLYTKHKMRMIFNGHKHKLASKQPPRYNVKSYACNARLSLKYRYKASFDLKNAFYSLFIAEKFQKFFGFRTSIGNFVYAKCPFGYSWCPFLLQIVTDQAVRRLRENGEEVTHYVDDFHVYANTPEACNASLKRCMKFFTDIGWRIAPNKTKLAHRRGSTLGIGYDLAKKTSYIPPSAIAKLRDLAARCRQMGVLSKKQVAAFIGHFVFFNFAIPGSLSRINTLLAFISDDDWTRRYDYGSLAPFIEPLIDLYASDGDCPIQYHTAPPSQIFTDATNRQLGIILPDGSAFARPIEYTQIYRAEALAISWLLSFKLLPRKFCLRCDNEALCHAIIKGRSNIAEANTLIKRILQLRLDGFTITCKWVATHLNPADAPSRIALTPSHIFENPIDLPSES